MARTDTLTNWATDVANSIREKTGKTDPIPASEFDTEIAAIESGDTSIEDGLVQGILTSYSNNRVTSIGEYVFNHSSITTFSFPNVTTIGRYAFSYSGITEITFPKVVDPVGGYIFSDCSKLANIYFPLLKKMPQGMFDDCRSLVNIDETNLPSVESIGDSVFGYCNKLENISLPLVTYIGSSCFKDCSVLKTVNFPSLTKIFNKTGTGESFRMCKLLESVDFPLLTSIASYTFAWCEALNNVNLPLVDSIEYGCFQYCKKLSFIDLPSVCSIKGYGFNNCSVLETIILRSETMCTLASEDAFYNTPIRSKTGYIYVPASLVDTYKTATNWTAYADQFRAIEDYPDICGEVTE